MAGHLGRQRTLKPIRRCFWWPSVTKVADYCRTCVECQKLVRQGQKVPLVPMPIIGEPFERIAMDTIGPLPKTAAGKQFVLVISDYTTRYPEAYVMTTITATSVAEKLMDLFSRHGVPREILTNQGTNFMSELLQELHKLLRIKSIRTSPYHPQTDGLVERFNQTLKQMLKKVLMTDRRSWDKLLPLVLFAYHEVPQEATGFSPFELIYSRDVKGLLDILKEEWIPTEDTNEDVATYVTHERMKNAQQLVQEHLKQDQQQQKTWYDHKPRDMKIEVGDQVLLLLPDRDSQKKFMRKWQSPFKIKHKHGRVNYEVIIDSEGNTKVYHINLLKKWFSSTETVSSYANTVKEDANMEFYERSDQQRPQINQELSEDQKSQLLKLIQKYPTVTTSLPGIQQCQPIHQKPYQLPPAYKEAVTKELEEMEKISIVKESESEWSSPMVIVMKKDGGICICVDFRKLNQLTKFDAYPMPHML